MNETNQRNGINTNLVLLCIAVSFIAQGQQSKKDSSKNSASGMKNINVIYD